MKMNYKVNISYIEADERKEIEKRFETFPACVTEVREHMLQYDDVIVSFHAIKGDYTPQEIIEEKLSLIEKLCRNRGANEDKIEVHCQQLYYLLDCMNEMKLITHDDYYNYMDVLSSLEYYV